jgi:hypothetical protein
VLSQAIRDVKWTFRAAAELDLTSKPEFLWPALGNFGEERSKRTEAEPSAE